jgi:SAM-dependent methyltransferase
MTQRDNRQESFGRYAAFYDALYSGKDYVREARYVLDLVALYGPALPDPLNILDLGCGTGRHLMAMCDLCDAEGVGVDMSPEMIAQARRDILSTIDNISFSVADARSFRSGLQHDLVMSLFHVFSYQVSLEDALAFLRTARAHMSDSSVLVFDYWFGPAVEADPPTFRQRQVMTEHRAFRRSATPTVLTDTNRVDVHYDIEVLGADPPESFTEDHSLRYWYTDEVCDLAAMAGLTVVGLHRSGTTAPPSSADWNCTACCVVADGARQ